MALSGQVIKNVGSNHRFILEWTATQNASANTSTITAKLYWQSLSTYGSVSSSATKYWTINIGSNTSSGTFSAALSGAQKKQIGTYTRTVSHNTNGELSLNIGFEATLAITLSGTYYGTQSNSANFTLDTIAGKATLTSIPERWTFDNPVPVSWTKAVSTDKVDVKLWVEHVITGARSLITTRLKLSGTSTTIELTQAEKDAVIAQRYGGNGYYWITLETFDASNNPKGDEDYLRKVIELPERGTLFKDASLPEYGVGQTHTITQDGPSLWSLEVDVHDASTDELLDTIPKFQGTTTWTPLRSLVPTGETSRAVKFKIYSYYGDNPNPIRTTSVDKTTNLVFTAAAPVWSGANPTVIDTNSATIALTGANTNLIQNLSNLRLNIPVGAAVAQDGATLTSYQVYKNATLVGTYSASTTQVSLGTWELSGTQSIKIYAIDNYGSSTLKELFVNLIPYKTPQITSNNLGRLNGYEGTIQGLVSGSYAPIIVGGVAKNALSSVVLSYKKSTDSSFTSAGNYTITHAPSSGTFSTTSKSIIGLTEADTYIIRIVATDVLGNAHTFEKTIAPGVPLVYFDKANGSVGFGKFPTNVSSIETDFTIRSVGIVNSGTISSNGNVSSNNNIVASNALYTTSGKLWIGSTAELNWDSANSRLKSTHTLHNSANKPYWHGSNLEIQYGSVFTSNEANTPKEITITFPTAFTSVPTIQLTVAVSAAQNINEATAYNVSTTGFTIYFSRITAVSTNANEIKWLAVAKN